MTAYVALLRGINVSGQKLMKMEDLRACFETLRFERVTTHLQSGNVIFRAEPIPSMGETIEAEIKKRFGFAVPVLVRTARELERVVQGNPWKEKSGIDPAKMHVTFLSAAAPDGAVKSLEALVADHEGVHVTGREVYLYCPAGYGRTKLSNAAIEKKLSVVATTRNWKSVNALSSLASAL